jgi:dolichol-phosphate mannosyltransferase
MRLSDVPSRKVGMSRYSKPGMPTEDGSMKPFDTQRARRLDKSLEFLSRLKRLADSRFGALSRFFQFCFVGTTGMVVDLCLYDLLLHLSLPISVARAAAILVAMTWNFWLNRWMTFRDRRDGGILTQYARFAASCSLGALMSWSVNMLLAKDVAWFGRHLLIAAFMGVLVGTVSNFLFSHLWVFRRARNAG